MKLPIKDAIETAFVEKLAMIQRTTPVGLEWAVELDVDQEPLISRQKVYSVSATLGLKILVPDGTPEQEKLSYDSTRAEAVRMILHHTYGTVLHELVNLRKDMQDTSRGIQLQSEYLHPLPTSHELSLERVTKMINLLVGQTL